MLADPVDAVAALDVHRVDPDERRTSTPRAQRVGAHPPGDAEQPGADGGAALEAVQRAERPQVRLLGEVVGGVAVAERGAQPPDVGLRRADERGRGQRITRRGIGREPLELLHRTSSLDGGNRTASRDD